MKKERKSRSIAQRIEALIKARDRAILTAERAENRVTRLSERIERLTDEAREAAEITVS